jgi:quinol monooxygenase YgiN
MTQLFTQGRWTVTEGREQEFIQAWRELADWTGENVDGASWAKLLQDRDRPNVFISFGKWTDMDAIQRWRSNPGFAERIGTMRGMLEDFEAQILDAVVEHE